MKYHFKSKYQKMIPMLYGFNILIEHHDYYINNQINIKNMF